MLITHDELHTARLLLRRFTINDAQAYWPLVALPEILRYTGEQRQSSLEDVRQILTTRPLKDYMTHGFGRLACIEKSSGRLVGFSGLKYLDDLEEIDIGYRFLPECWSKGYATESVRAILDDDAARNGKRRIIGLVDRDNIASSRVLQKLHLQFESTLHLEGHIPMDLYANQAR